VLALKPGDSDAPKRTSNACRPGASFPDQEVVRGRFTTVELQDSGLPISINGVQATYWFDTGADVSVLSASEAKRFGLRVLAEHNQRKMT